MTTMQFESYWLSNYAESTLLPHLFKYHFKNRYFRILASKETKRNNFNSNNFEKFLSYQNRVMSDLIGSNNKIWGITGEYGLIDVFENPDCITKGLLSKYTFMELNPIDMHKVSATEFKAGEIYRSFITELTWQSNKFDDLLKSIATDKVRMFFVCLTPKCLIAPFDGGIDFVLENTEDRNKLEKRYRSWFQLETENA